MNEQNLTLPENFSEFETQISSVRPRLFDTYILPPFIMYYAYKSKSMGKVARRILFVAGVYMAYRSYNEYKNLAMSVAAMARKEEVPV